MFSKSKISDTEAQAQGARPQPAPPNSKPGTAIAPPTPASLASGSNHATAAASPGPSAGLPAKSKPSPSLLSSDLTVKGNVSTSGDIQIEGTIEGDVRAHLLTVGESATIRGEVIADDVVVNGRVVGRLRGLKVRLTATSKVEGDIVHKSIAIESGAHFEGSVQRSEDPLGDGAVGNRPVPSSAAESLTASRANRPIEEAEGG